MNTMPVEEAQTKPPETIDKLVTGEELAASL
jgi:hypothetical protein